MPEERIEPGQRISPIQDVRNGSTGEEDSKMKDARDEDETRKVDHDVSPRAANVGRMAFRTNGG